MPVYTVALIQRFEVEHMPIMVESYKERSIHIIHRTTSSGQPSLIDNSSLPLSDAKTSPGTNYDIAKPNRREGDSSQSSQAALPRYSSMGQSPAIDEEEIERKFSPPKPGCCYVQPARYRYFNFQDPQTRQAQAPKIERPNNTNLSAYRLPKDCPPQKPRQDHSSDSHVSYNQVLPPRIKRFQPYQAESNQINRRSDVGLSYNSSDLKPMQKVHALEPAQLGKFDGIQSVRTFVNRVTSMVNRHSESDVLDVLPLCLEGQAQEWYDSLSKHTRDRMDQNVSIWIEHLQLRFQLDPITAEKKAEKCKFTFKNESKLSLRAYIDRKLILLREAGFDGDYQLKEQIWNGLDPVLQDRFLGIRGESLRDFIQRLYAHELPAKKAWRQENRPNTEPTPTPNSGSCSRERLQRGGGK